MSRLLFISLSVGVGIALGSLVPQISETIRAGAHAIPIPALTRLLPPPDPNGGTGSGHGPGDGHAHGPKRDAHGAGGKPDGHAHGAGEKHNEGPEGAIKMSADQISVAKIEVAAAEQGTLSRRLSVPGTVVPDANRVARVAAKVVGTVADLSKQLGDTVAKGDVVAILDSREVAEAKSEYLAATVNFELQRTLFEREQSLFQKNITAEQQFLRARTTFSEAQLRLDLARHKLSALGVPDKEIAGLSRQSTALQRYELRSPISGRVVERLVNLGTPVGGEGQAKELYGIADLSEVWVELNVSTADLVQVREGQPLSVSSGSEKRAEGKIIFISPILNPETRSARVIAALPNQDMTWRPGTFVTAEITVEEQSVPTRIPRTAIQTIGGEKVVFVRTADGFEKREVALGKGDDRFVELAFGVDPGEQVAVTNSFVLKAELGKAEAEHSH